MSKDEFHVAWKGKTSVEKACETPVIFSLLFMSASALSRERAVKQ